MYIHLHNYVHILCTCITLLQELSQSVTDLKPQISAVQSQGKHLKDKCSSQVRLYQHMVFHLEVGSPEISPPKDQSPPPK